VSTAPQNTGPMTVKDYKTDQQIKWCPGCGDHSILVQLQKVLALHRTDKDNTVFVSGIGCSSRFPYYMDTYGIHGIHGRAPAIATGVKCANPDLNVWVVTGDGDGLSIGGNHMLHTIRRNIGLKIILFNNRIYGLTKGQYSPTSEYGIRTKSSPFGSIDHPVHPLSVALGAEITWCGRAIDTDVQHLQHMFNRMMEHKGTAFLEVYQNCQVFNDNAYLWATDRQTRDEHVIYLEHGKPMVFGKNRDKGVRLNGDLLEVVRLDQVSTDDLVIHDEKAPDPSMAFRLSRMTHPDMPEPVGVFRAIEKAVYEEMMLDQLRRGAQKPGAGDLQKLFHAGDTWKVE
jgi:2-oxoglutarate/2-oxoacid ferredoxin oxidoreductase subunit beta